MEAPVSSCAINVSMVPHVDKQMDCAQMDAWLDISVHIVSRTVLVA